MSWLHPGKWLLYLALIAALILGVWRLDKWRQSIGYEKRSAEVIADRAKQLATAIAPLLTGGIGSPEPDNTQQAGAAITSRVH